MVWEHVSYYNGFSSKEHAPSRAYRIYLSSDFSSNFFCLCQPISLHAASRKQSCPHFHAFLLQTLTLYQTYISIRIVLFCRQSMTSKTSIFNQDKTRNTVHQTVAHPSMLVWELHSIHLQSYYHQWAVSTVISFLSRERITLLEKNKNCRWWKRRERQWICWMNQAKYCWKSQELAIKQNQDNNMM